MTLRFGTDGIRGIANRELSPELVTALGRAAARVLGTDKPFVVGRDTCRSGPMVEAALVAGICAEGANVLLAGVVPTPAVAHLARVRDAPGAVISASHNPFQDNGVKLFAPGGRKIPDELEHRVEREVALLAETASAARTPGTRRRRRQRAARRGRRVRHPSGRRARGPAARRSPGRRRLRQRRGVPGRAARAPRARRAGRRAATRRRTARTSTGTAVRPTRRSCRARWCSRARTPAWRSTATPIESSPSTSDGAIVDGDQIMLVARARPEGARQAARATRSSRR